MGGHDVNISSYPWQVSIFDDNNYFCGGVLISQSWVLTAASCMRHPLSKGISIRAGSSSWKSGGQKIDVKRFVIHPDLNTDKPEHNLALLELGAKLTVSSAKPAILASISTDLSSNNNVSVTGWGRVNASAFFYPLNLQAIQMTIVDQNLCIKQYEKSYNVTENMFCAGITEGKSPCYGDDGGSVSSENMVVGIINTWGVKCVLSPTSAIFMKVAKYKDWINSVISS